MRLERRQQNVVQVRACQRGIRRAVACLGLFSQGQHAQEARVDTAANLQLGRKSRHRAQSGLQTQIMQNTGGVGAQLYPGPHGGERLHLLKYLYPMACAGTGQRGS